MGQQKFDRPGCFSTERPSLSLPGTSPTLRAWPHAILARLGEAIVAWRRRAQSRRALTSLSDHMLRDLNLNRSDIETRSWPD